MSDALAEMPPPIDPTLESLYDAAKTDAMACDILADYLEEHGADPEDVHRARRGLPDRAIGGYLGHRYGWWSDDADKLFGHFVWRTPDGREVAVTWCTTTPDEIRRYDWPDKRYVGAVKEFVRSKCSPIWANYSSVTPRFR